MRIGVIVYFLSLLFSFSLCGSTNRFCDSVGGNLQNQTFTANTAPGSNIFFEFNHFRGDVSFVSFFLSGNCSGQWHVDGLQPVTAYVRSDGIPWYFNSDEYDYQLNMYDYESQDLPIPTQWGGAIFGYDGECSVQLTMQFCECNPGYMGMHCAYNNTMIKNWGESSTEGNQGWSYYCIPQGTPNTPSAYVINFATNDTKAALMMNTRWGAIPNYQYYDTQDIIFPGQSPFNKTISYPKYVIRNVNETNSTHTLCYWVGIYNPTPNPVSYTITYNVSECVSGTGGNCSSGNAQVGQQLTTESSNTWTYFTFDPSKLLTAVNSFLFYLISSESSLELYTRREGPPTLSLHDDFEGGGFGNRSRGHNGTVIHHPQFAMDHNTMWWVGVYNPNNVRASFTVNSSAIYCTRCNTTNGKCIMNASAFPYCACNSGFAGQDCSSTISMLVVGVATNFQSVAPYNTNYLSFRVPLHKAGQIMYISVAQAPNAQVQFLLLNAFVPSSYDYSYKNSAGSFTIVIPANELVTGDTWYMSASETYGMNTSYSITIVLGGDPFIPTTSTTSGNPTTSTSTASISSSSSSTSVSSSTSSSNMATTGFPATGPSSTTGPDVIIHYRLDGGAAAGIAISMLAAGLVIGLAAAYFLARRRFAGYASLRGNANFD